MSAHFPFKAIAAMALNRVIGQGNSIPWHLPEDFKWFKQTTTGHVIVMGRKTFQSVGRPLPNRTTVVLTRGADAIPGVRCLQSLDQLAGLAADYPGKEIFICGGAEVYRQTLSRCSDLYLTLVNRTVDGDTSFPPFEHEFELIAELRDTPEFKILHYARRQ